MENWKENGTIATYSEGWEDVDCSHLVLDSNQRRILMKDLMNSQREEEVIQLVGILVLNKGFSVVLVETLTEIPNHGLKSLSQHLCWALLVCLAQNDIIYHSTLLLF
jgi:hypothetical protein